MMTAGGLALFLIFVVFAIWMIIVFINWIDPGR